MTLCVLVALLSSGGLTTTHPIPGGGSVEIWSSGPRTQNAKVWSCEEPLFSASHQALTANENSISFADPEGKASGTASWGGIKRSFYEGEKVVVTLSCKNMILSFSGESCADGKRFFSRGVRHPWDPDRSSQKFEFTFQPVTGIDRVAISLVASPSLPGNYTSTNASVRWNYVPGVAKDSPQKSSLSAIDARLVSAGVLMQGAPVQEITDISPYLRQALVPKGIAADGSSLLLLRAHVSKADSATFTVAGAGGALYPLSGQIPVKSAGATALKVQTRESGGEHYALALYRPPSYFGGLAKPKSVDFRVKFAGGADSSLSIRLVPPPIVLVHGTYDNPKFCYEEHAPEDDTLMNMAPMLRDLGYDVWCVDWEDTNGNKDPSDFQHNRLAVWQNSGGIKEALEATRRKGIVVSQADVICHSQGGVITRTYARGFPFSIPMPPTHPHYTDPKKCKSGSEFCWYHRPDNHFLGDIHRLITISTTHRGSHVLNVFKELASYPDETVSQEVKKLMVDIFLVGIDKGVSGITTGGVLNQIPDSLELQLVGPTPVASHAIACVASDEDMRNQRPDSIGEAIKGSELGMGNYWNKFYKVWLGTTNEAREFLFGKLTTLAGQNGMADPAGEYAKYKDLAGKVTINEDARNVRMDALIYNMRKIVFQGQENDCTVGILSSFGGLESPYRTRIPNVLHGWAPRYRAVQLKVLNLLVGDGREFDKDGFPGYSGIKSKASSFAVEIPPLDKGAPLSDSVISRNPDIKQPPVSTPGITQPPVEEKPTIRPGEFSPESLSHPEAWKDSSGGGGTVTFDNGRLRLMAPNEPEAEAATFFRAPIKGDFDFIFDYKLESWKAGSEGQVQFDILLSPSPKTIGEDYILFGRRTTEDGDAVAVAPWNGLPEEEVKASTSGGGRLRASRKRAKWVISQWDGKTWKAVSTFDSAEHPEVYLGFALSIGGKGETAKVSVEVARGN